MTLAPAHRLPIRTAIAAIALVAVALTLMACASAGASNASGEESGGIYRLPIADPGSEIDPLTVSDPNAQIITGLVTEPLVSLNARGNLDPRLATSWITSEDGLTWTISLRPGAQFNDGRRVTSKDVVATFKAILSEDSVSPGAGAFDGVLSSVAPVGDDTVDFTLERPFADFPLLLTGANTAILPADYVPGTWLENPVGAGQFLLADYSIGRGATYVKNPDYWNADEIELAGVELKVFGDSQARLLAFQAGDIDRIGLTPEVASAVDLSDYNVISSGYNRFDGIFLDVTRSPFDDPTLREALAWAVDREGLVADVYAGNADIANDTTFFPDYRPQPTGLEQRDQDLDKVDRLLAGRTLAFTITTPDQLLGEVLQQQLNAVPGFDVEIDVLTSEQYYADGDSTPWLNAPVTVTSWAKRVPSQYLSLVYAEGASWNASRYANSRLDDLAVRFDGTTDPVDRQELADQIAEIQWADVPAIIPTFSKSQALQNTRVKGTFIGALDFYTGYSFAGISIAD